MRFSAWLQEEFRAAMLPRRRTGGLSSSRRRERRDRSAEVLTSLGQLLKLGLHTESMLPLLC